MSATEPLSLMISSRCNDPVHFEGTEQTMSALRKALKEKLEAIRLGRRQVFRVWIHEDESNTSALINNWEVCVLWHLHSELGEFLARRIYNWLRPGNGLGPQVFYRSLPAPEAPEGRLPPQLPGEPCSPFPTGVNNRRRPEATPGIRADAIGAPKM